MREQDRKYELLASKIIDDWKDHLNIRKVEGKQKSSGSSGALWEHDLIAKRVKDNDDEELVLVEVKRRGTDKLKQSELGAFAYKIKDTGATSGIIVTSVGLQEGAKKIAEHAEMEEIIIDPRDCTEDEYIAYLGKKFVAQISVHIPKGKGVFVSISSDKDGKPIVKRKSMSQDALRSKIKRDMKKSNLS